jgi:hypothetical protein
MSKRTTSIFSFILVLGLAGVSLADLVAYWDFEGGFADAWGSNDATPQGDAAIILDPERGRVAEFDGNGDYLEIPNSPSLNITGDQITLTSWVYFDDVSGGPEIVLAKIVQDGQHVAPYFAYNLCILSNGTPRLMLVTSGSERRLPGSPNFESGRWYHMAGTYDGSEMILYVDGEVSATMNVTGNINGYDTPLLRGINGGRTEPMDGRIDDVRIYNHTLDQTEIQAVMLQVGGGYPYAMALDPEDGAIHEDTWVTLSWRPGDFAVSHDIYLGDNFSDVNEATRDSDLFRGNQTDSFIIAGFFGFPYPEGLVPGQTYYWRIDEVNDAEPNSPWKGGVWSFTVPPKTAYSPIPADGAELIPVDVTLTWIAGLGAKLHYIILGEDYDVVNNAVAGTPSGTTNYNPGPLELAKTYYWRVDESDGFETYKGEVWSFTTEGAVSGPNPADGAEYVSATQILTWNAGAVAASHEVYFGTDADAVANATKASPEYKGPKTLDDESYDPGQLALQTAYYWRIDEVNDTNPDSPWKGNVWSFTTGDFFVIDNFEDYNADTNQIWWAWKDGLGYVAHDNEPAYPGNGTGSAVGDETTASYTEETIVHGGNQSMPFLYDNNKQGYANYSEAELTLTAQRDWMAEGVAELSLWFRGYPASTGSFVEGPVGTYTMTGSGADIWNIGSGPGEYHDEFHFAYKMLTGAGSIIARIESVENTNAWAKAGVMIRETLDGGSKHAFACITPANGVASQGRPDTSAASSNTNQSGITAPHWVKLERSISGLFTVSHSADGSNWQPVTGTTALNISMGSNVYIGLAVTSHDAALTCQAVFSNVSTTGTVSGQWAHQDIGILSNDAEPLYVAVSNNTGNPAVVVHDDPTAAQIDTWTEWVIPLSAFADQGIDLTDVDRIAIGLGTQGNITTPGGKGKMYIDDIRLYQPREAAE